MRKPFAILVSALVFVAVALGFGLPRWQAGGASRASVVVYDSGADSSAPNANDKGDNATPSPADVSIADSYSVNPSVHDAATRLMAVDAEYVPGHVLASFADDVTYEEASALLSHAWTLDFSGLSREEFENGIAVLDVADDCVVEDAVVELSGMGLVSVAQPNYIYQVASDGAAAPGALLERLAAGLEIGELGTGGGFDAAFASPLEACGLGLTTQASPVSVNDFDDCDASTRYDRSWHLTDVNAFSAWAYLRDENGAVNNDVCVAVIDDGFYVDNAELTANCKVTYNATNKGTNVSEVSGHGTHVAGIVAAEANNGYGAAGVSYNADLALIKVANDSGTMTTEYLCNAYDFVKGNRNQRNIRVANVSLAMSVQKKDGTIVENVDPLVNKKTKELYESGIVLVTAAGNKGSDVGNNGVSYTQTPPYACFPSDVPYSVSVINLAKDRQRSPSSNYNRPGSSFKSISAPGTSIYSTKKSGLGFLSGTSMASPIVAGVFSLAFAEKPELTASEARAIAYCTAYDVKASGTGWDEQTGYGEIDALAVMQCLNPTTDGPTGLTNGQKGQLKLVCGSDDASVTWSSSDPGVVSVDAGGVVACHGPGSATITATFTIRDREGDTYAGSASHTMVINDIHYAEVGVPEQTYTGSSLTPAPTVTLGGTPLVAGRDYAVESYANNVNAGTASITIKGSGTYSGTSTSTFKINPASISGASVAAATATYDYRNGYTATTATVTLGGRKLVQGTDYVLEDLSGNTAVGTGVGSLTVRGIGNYTGIVSSSFDIVPCDLSDVDDLEISLAGCAGSSSYNNPIATVLLAGKALVEGTDYRVEYSYPSATTGTCTVTFAGRFTGEKVTGFERPPASLAQAIAVGAEQTYAGVPFTTTVTVTLDGRTLLEGRDFQVETYADNVNAGTASFTVRGMGSYDGTASGSFTIKPKDIGQASVTAGLQAYTGSEVKPVPTVTLDGHSLRADTDFVASYANNVNPGTADVVVTGRGNYAGSASGHFRITPVSLSNATVSAATQKYTGSALTPAPKVVLNGRELSPDTDYAVKYYSDNVNAGSAKITVTGRGAYSGDATGSFAIEAKDLSGAKVAVNEQVYSGDELRPAATVTLDGRTLADGTDYELSYANNVNPGTANVVVTGRGNYSGSAKGTFSIVRPDLSRAEISMEDQTYTGSALRPVPTVELGGRTLSVNEDYFVIFRNNVYVGTASFSVIGKGSYGGAASGTFRILPRSISGAVVTVSDQDWTGSPLTPPVTVVLEGRTLSGSDFSCSYSNNVEAGAATVTVTGQGNYTGSAWGSFRVVAPAPTPEPKPEPTPEDTHVPDPIQEGPGVGITMHRLYNPNSGEHFYTASAYERDALSSIGWTYEGVGWVAPSAGEAVYRLYNPYSGDHHYTTSAAERNALSSIGWTYEGEGWKSGGGVAVLRQYNPFAQTATHNYTTGAVERDFLVSIGWRDEGVGWYAIAAG